MSNAGSEAPQVVVHGDVINGISSLQIYPNDDSGTQPKGTGYVFRFYLDGAPMQERMVVVPSGSPTVDFAAFAPALTEPLFGYDLAGTAQALFDGVSSGGGINQITITGISTPPAVAHNIYTILLKPGAVPTLPPVSGNTCFYQIINKTGADLSFALSGLDTLEGSASPILLRKDNSLSLSGDGTSDWVIV